MRIFSSLVVYSKKVPCNLLVYGEFDDEGRAYSGCDLNKQQTNKHMHSNICHPHIDQVCLYVFVCLFVLFCFVLFFVKFCEDKTSTVLESDCTHCHLNEIVVNTPTLIQFSDRILDK